MPHSLADVAAGGAAVIGAAGAKAHLGALLGRLIMIRVYKALKRNVLFVGDCVRFVFSVLFCVLGLL